jgi:hypothetical protein
LNLELLDVKQAIARNELIFWVEGESTADALWDLGIATIPPSAVRVATVTMEIISRI